MPIVIARAKASRAKYGGIWRGGQFWDLEWRSESVTQEIHDLLLSDPHIEVGVEPQEQPAPVAAQPVVAKTAKSRK